MNDAMASGGGGGGKEGLYAANSGWSSSAESASVCPLKRTVRRSSVAGRLTLLASDERAGERSENVLNVAE